LEFCCARAGRCGHGIGGTAVHDWLRYRREAKERERKQLLDTLTAFPAAALRAYTLMGLRGAEMEGRRAVAEAGQASSLVRLFCPELTTVVDKLMTALSRGDGHIYPDLVKYETATRKLLGIKEAAVSLTADTQG